MVKPIDRQTDRQVNRNLGWSVGVPETLGAAVFELETLFTRNIIPVTNVQLLRRIYLSAFYVVSTGIY